MYENEQEESPYGTQKEGEVLLKDVTIIEKGRVITINGGDILIKLDMDIRTLTERKQWLKALQDHSSHYFPLS